MKQEFIPYEQALELKKLGFDEPCFGYYSEGELILNSHTNNHMQRFRYSAPTFSQAFRWFREKYGLDSFVKHLYKSTIKVGYYFGVDEYKCIDFQMDLDDYFKTYEEAELACLVKLIEIAKQK